MATNGASLGGQLQRDAGLSQPAITAAACASACRSRASTWCRQGQLYGDRINALDMRFGKILRFGRTRTNVALDLYNLFNSNTGTAFNQALRR